GAAGLGGAAVRAVPLVPAAHRRGWAGGGTGSARGGGAAPAARAGARAPAAFAAAPAGLGARGTGQRPLRAVFLRPALGRRRPAGAAGMSRGGAGAHPAAVPPPDRARADLGLDSARS